MSDSSKRIAEIPPGQRAIRVRCFHPTGTFIEFKKDEVEQSIPDCFEKIVCLYPDRLAIKAGDRSLTYQQLNQAVNHAGGFISTQNISSGNPFNVFVRGANRGGDAAGIAENQGRRLAASELELILNELGSLGDQETERLLTDAIGGKKA